MKTKTGQKKAGVFVSKILAFAGLSEKEREKKKLEFDNKFQDLSDIYDPLTEM